MQGPSSEIPAEDFAHALEELLELVRGDCPELDRWLRAVDRFQSTNVEEFYESLIKSCSHSGNILFVEAVVMRMGGMGIPITSNTCNGVVHTYTRAGDMDRAEHFIGTMEGTGCTNIVTYNTIIDAYAARGDEDGVRFWMGRMSMADISPNIVTQGSLCKLFARQGRVADIERLMADVEATGQRLNEYFFASLISACGNTSPPSVCRALRAVDELRCYGIRPQRVRRLIKKVLGQSLADIVINEEESMEPKSPQAGRSSHSARVANCSRRLGEGNGRTAGECPRKGCRLAAQGGSRRTSSSESAEGWAPSGGKPAKSVARGHGAIRQQREGPWSARQCKIRAPRRKAPQAVIQLP
mmetsp:Transcript_24542/g.54635  ORF Transcript_24542/g.54635 Transcript_24542/m.54635 type:complete len:355 (+) Transcript_24542:61-1125(+)